MSLFVLVDRFGAARRIYRNRSLALHLGEIVAEISEFSLPRHSFFSVYCLDNRHCLYCDQDNLYLNGHPWSVGSSRWLDEHDVIEGYEYRFSFIITSACSELRAHDNAMILDAIDTTIDQSALPSIILKIAGLSRSFPLIPNLKLSVGSSQSSHIMISAPFANSQVKDTHCVLLFQDGKLLVQPANGEVSVNGKVLQENTVIDCTVFDSTGESNSDGSGDNGAVSSDVCRATITLLPGDVALELRSASQLVERVD